MSVLSSMIPSSWIKSIIAAVIVFVGGYASNMILSQVGTEYVLAPGIKLVVSQTIADSGTNAVAMIVQKLQAALQK